MRLVLAVTAATALLAPAAAWPQGESGHQDRFMNTPVKETVYATEHHMGFSIRAELIRWLGGVPIVDERDLRASEQQRWWGDDVPLLPGDVVKNDR